MQHEPPKRGLFQAPGSFLYGGDLRSYSASPAPLELRSTESGGADPCGVSGVTERSEVAVASAVPLAAHENWMLGVSRGALRHTIMEMDNSPFNPRQHGLWGDDFPLQTGWFPLPCYVSFLGV